MGKLVIPGELEIHYESDGRVFDITIDDVECVDADGAVVDEGWKELLQAKVDTYNLSVLTVMRNAPWLQLKNRVKTYLCKGE